MKSRDIAIVGILLAIGAIVRYLSLFVPGPIVSNLVIAFYCLAVILIAPTVKEALGIGIVAGVICAMLSHSIFPPANLISEPIGAIVCLGVYTLLRSRIVAAPAITTFVATLASGFAFIGIALLAIAPMILGKYGTVAAFMVVTGPIVVMTAVICAIVAQALYIPASRVLMRAASENPSRRDDDPLPVFADGPSMRAPAIHLTNVSYTYPKTAKPVLKGINLTVDRGHFILISGPTGAGKTTLCLAIAGILHHEYGGSFEGSIAVAGKDVREYRDMAELGKQIGVVFDDADAQLIFTTVEEEIASGLENQGLTREEMQERMNYVTKVTGISDLMERAPHTLSGGQKQRVAIAATLALGTDIVILDEPTAELDEVATIAIVSILKRLKQEGKTVIIVEHKLDALAALADTMVLIENGEIRAQERPDLLIQSELVRNLLNDGARPVSCTCRPPLPAGVKPIITVANLSHRYDEAAALANVSLDFYPGEIVAIVGENGSGKTTLVKHFNGLLHPTEGSVTVDGIDTATVPITELARHVGLVFQNPDSMLFEETVEREVAFGLKNIGHSDSEQVIAKVLDEVGLLQLRSSYPRSMSRGERQRLALACVIAMQPPVIILDEPTTGLDARESRKVMDIVQRLREQGHTIIMVTHNMQVVQDYADRIVEMAYGKVVRDVRSIEELRCQRLCSTSTGLGSSTA